MPTKLHIGSFVSLHSTLATLFSSVALMFPFPVLPTTTSCLDASKYLAEIKTLTAAKRRQTKTKAVNVETKV